MTDPIAKGTPSRCLPLLCLGALLGTVAFPVVAGHEGATSGSFGMGEFVMAPLEGKQGVTVDGKVTSGEYGPYGRWMDEDTGFTGNFAHDNDSLFVALSNPKPGWVALGFSSDLDVGMEFIVVGESGGRLQAVERVVSNLSGDLAFAAPPASDASPLETFNESGTGKNITVELRLSLRSSLWSLEPGNITPAIVAFNDTSLALPTNTAGSELHYLRFYPLRAQDDPGEVKRLFAMDTSPVPALVAMALLATGVAFFLRAFLWRRDGKESRVR